MDKEFLLDKLTFLQHQLYTISVLVFGLCIFSYIIYRSFRKTQKEFEQKKKTDLDNSQILFHQLNRFEKNLSGQIKELRNDVEKTALNWDHTHELEKQRISSKIEEMNTTLEKVIEITNKLNDTLINTGVDLIIKKK